jgi:hypothetical protein
MVERRVCTACGAIIKGRSDKKFCDDTCRNNFNNQLRSDHTTIMRSISKSLSKNRRILKNLLSEKEQTITIKKEKLLELGFLFTYHTHTYTNQKSGTYFYCYDYGYLPLKNNFYLVVRQKNVAPDTH